MEKWPFNGNVLERYNAKMPMFLINEF